MAGSRYAVMLHFKGGAPPVDRVEGVLDQCKDWLRFNSQAWLIYTGLPPEKVRDRLKAEFKVESPSILIVECGPDWSTYSTEVVRKWLAKTDQESRTGE